MGNLLHPAVLVVIVVAHLWCQRNPLVPHRGASCHCTLGSPAAALWRAEKEPLLPCREKTRTLRLGAPRAIGVRGGMHVAASGAAPRPRSLRRHERRRRHAALAYCWQRRGSLRRPWWHHAQRA